MKMGMMYSYRPTQVKPKSVILSIIEFVEHLGPDFLHVKN